ncbi:MFS transporter [Ideonella livida]|uniref:MFS transporter n=1 Tax=Ideonella livida TaxID=2707176 RepID=A0A7C9PEJ2_9BURK|nr:MFS transporter [Ideonella livida]NDY89591.1 MFS transporter [Ideonella livida]
MSDPMPDDAPSLRLRDLNDFRQLLLARVAGTTANQMLMVALGWQMYELTRSAWDLGLVGLAQFLPALLLTLPAGQWVDRHDRRLALGISLGLQALAALWLAVASTGGWLGAGAIWSVSVLLGCARALQMPALQALLPSLVPAAVLPRAVAASSSTMQAATVLGPAVGGGLYALGPTLAGLAGHTDPAAGLAWGGGLVHGLAAAALCAALWGVSRIRHRARPAVRPAEGWTGLTAGLRFIAQRPVLLGAVSLDLFAVLLGGATALLPIFARDILHTGPEGLGLLRAAPALGAVGVGLWLARRPLQRRAGVVLLAGVAVYGLATLGFAASTSLVAAFVSLMVAGGADMVSVVIRQSLVQLETPDEMRGRVAAVNSVFIGASNQLGEFESGLTAAWLGPVGSVVLGGVGTLAVVAAWCRLFPALRRRDRLQPG